MRNWYFLKSVVWYRSCWYKWVNTELYHQWLLCCIKSVIDHTKGHNLFHASIEQGHLPQTVPLLLDLFPCVLWFFRILVPNNCFWGLIDVDCCKVLAAQWVTSKAARCITVFLYSCITAYLCTEGTELFYCLWLLSASSKSAFYMLRIGIPWH